VWRVCVAHPLLGVGSANAAPVSVLQSSMQHQMQSNVERLSASLHAAALVVLSGWYRRHSGLVS